MSEIKNVIESFAAQLTAFIDAQALSRAREAVFSALGGSPLRGPGRPPTSAALAMPTRGRKKMPRQLCPVPGCKNTAAPIFGMVCAKHKDVAKSKIKKFREARKAKKEKAAA